MSKKEDLLLMAEHQLLGFFHAKNGYSLEDLVRGMGLDREEFDTLVSDGAVSQISQEDLTKISNILLPSNPIASGYDRTVNGWIGQP